MALVCLIVDNPLRDLDGLVLLARTFAMRGIDAALVPLYSQAFDIAALGPDLVIANYARLNNRDLLIDYRRRGIRVGVLDTEGVGGRSMEEFAQISAHAGAQEIVDFYCAWGPAQFEVLQPIFGETLKLTGCPRFDFCAPKWQAALRKPGSEPGYVLINTNFPAVNPRFSGGSAAEAKAAVRAGFSEDVAEQYLQRARSAMLGMIAVTRSLAEHLPHRRFVLRPHPFESLEPYRSLEDLANVALHQEGTSLDWLAASRLLVHLNCSTAIEANMLGRSAISPAWLDHEAIRVPGPSSVSIHANTEGQLIDLVETAFGDKPLAHPAIARQTVIDAYYGPIDGRAAERVAEASIAVLNAPLPGGVVPRKSARGRMLGPAQYMAGPKTWFRMVDLGSKGVKAKRRSAKAFDETAVRDVLHRLAAADNAVVPVVEAVNPGTMTLARPRQSSGGAVLVRRVS